MQFDSSHDAFIPVRDALIEAARDRGILTYRQVSDIMGYSGRGVEMGRRVGAMGDAINRVERDAGRPMLSALIVKERSRVPGKGFYLGAIDLERATDFVDDAAERAFWESERDVVYREWAP